MKFRHALLATTLLATPFVASGAQAQSAWWTPPSWLATPVAQPVTGLYVSGGAGWNHVDKRNLTALGGNATYFDNTVNNRQGDVKFNEGWGGQVAVGWGFGNGIRAEVEGNYRRNVADNLGGWSSKAPRSGVGGAFSKASGQLEQYGVMANAYYDFQLPAWFPQMPIPVVPYVGGGVGYVWNDLNGVGARRLPNGNSVVLDDTRGSFAYQGIAGLAFPIPQVPGLALTVEYRYMGSLQKYFDGSVRNETTRQTISTGRYEVDAANNHSAMLGLRYALYTPPAVAAAPPMAPMQQAPQSSARTYLVFFDWDRSDLTDRARQIIAEAAQNSRSGGVTRLEVSGHADRSGTPQYNQRLSQRRADTVAAELARNGVQRSQMVVQAFGESRPLVATADGVREPQNRRVEIVLR